MTTVVNMLYKKRTIEIPYVTLVQWQNGEQVPVFPQKEKPPV